MEESLGNSQEIPLYVSFHIFQINLTKKLEEITRRRLICTLCMHTPTTYTILSSLRAQTQIFFYSSPKNDGRRKSPSLITMKYSTTCAKGHGRQINSILIRPPQVNYYDGDKEENVPPNCARVRSSGSILILRSI